MRDDLSEETPSPSPSQAQLQGSGSIAQGQGNVTAGANSLVAGRDVNVNVIAPVDAEQLWHLLGERRPSADLTRATARYLEYLVDYYRYLDFRGMGVSDRIPLRLPLLEMYVPLKARMETPQGETWGRDLRLGGRAAAKEEIEGMGERLSGPLPVLDLLRKHDGLILLGDPGAGKTTFLKFLALTLATGQGEAIGLGNRLPVLLPLSAYANALEKGDVPLEKFVGLYYQSDRGIGLPLDSMLRRSLEQGGVLLLLDGLDEVRDRWRRHLVVDRVRELYALHRKAGNKFVLTSRIVGYREVRPEAEGLAECTLVDFEDDDIQEFVGKWTVALEKAASGGMQVAVWEAEREKSELLRAVAVNPGVRSLAANPLLLTILALMKRQGVALPERRVELYKTYVDTLLKHWNLARSLAGRSGRDLDVVETTKVLAPLALWMHQESPGVGLVKEGDLRREVERIYQERGHDDPANSAWQFLEDVRDHAALLLDKGGRQYGFIHLTFQEYLAAVAIAQKGQQGPGGIADILAAHVEEAPWHEVALLTIGYLGIVQQWEELAGAVLEELLRKAPEPAREAVILAGRAIVDAGPGGVTPRCRKSVIEQLLETLRDDQRVTAKRRAAAGEVLANLGDPRPEVTTIPGMAFCTVPAGPFRMGDDRYEEEKPAHDFNIPYEYRIGRYPVTVAQFRELVEASGFEPGDPDCLRGPANHPVVWVSWLEARAFCDWLTERWRKKGRLKKGEVVRLPS
jgi:Sulfatase-modifying factor enzyme 1/NACHT domain